MYSLLTDARGALRAISTLAGEISVALPVPWQVGLGELLPELSTHRTGMVHP